MRLFVEGQERFREDQKIIFLIASRVAQTRKSLGADPLQRECRQLPHLGVFVVEQRF